MREFSDGALRVIPLLSRTVFLASHGKLRPLRNDSSAWAGWLSLRLVLGLFKSPLRLMAPPLAGWLPLRRGWHDTNLVDPASSHMLVSKIKPCMSQYKLLYGETANGSLKQL